MLPGKREGNTKRNVIHMSGLQMKRFIRNAKMHRTAITRNWRQNTKKPNMTEVGIRARRGVKSNTPTIRCSIRTSSSFEAHIVFQKEAEEVTFSFLSLPNCVCAKFLEDLRFCFLFSWANCPLSNRQVKLRHFR